MCLSFSCTNTKYPRSLVNLKYSLSDSHHQQMFRSLEFSQFTPQLELESWYLFSSFRTFLQSAATRSHSYGMCMYRILPTHSSDHSSATIGFLGRFFVDGMYVYCRPALRTKNLPHSIPTKAKRKAPTTGLTNLGRQTSHS